MAKSKNRTPKKRGRRTNKSVNFKSRLVSPNIVTSKTGKIVRRSSTVPGTGGMGGAGSAAGGSIQSMAQSPLYYDYRWSTPDKFYFPRNRVVANAIWREIYKRDATVSIATDMYAELPWSNFSLTGVDDPEIKKIYEDMFSNINLVPKLSEFTKDYLITGEFIPHAIFDASKGIWERVISLNPDYIKAEGIGLLLDQPLLWLRPTPEIKRLINATDPRVRKLQKLLPKEILNSVRQNREIYLDALNTSFIPRLNSSSDIRGTSIYTRIYRSTMYEDFVVNASLAVAQRNAAPLRIFKLGDPNTGWVPSEDDQAALAEMLSMAESDPLAAIITHSSLTVDLVGVSDRMLLISREWDFIERVKLLALGVAKSFLVGESSFAASVAGLQTLLERLANLRNRFETDWIVKKLMVPMAKMHGFYERTQAELDHGIRIESPEKRLLVPDIKWEKDLVPTQDTAILSIWRDLKERGILSDRTYAQGSGIDLDLERKNQEEERKYIKDNPEMFAPMDQGQAPTGKPPIGGVPSGKPPAEGFTPKPLPAPLPLPGKEMLSKFKRSGSEEGLYNNLEYDLQDIADKDGKVSVNDVLEIIKNANEEKNIISQKLDESNKILSIPKPNLLSGS